MRNRKYTNRIEAIPSPLRVKGHFISIPSPLRGEDEGEGSKMNVSPQTAPVTRKLTP